MMDQNRSPQEEQRECLLRAEDISKEFRLDRKHAVHAVSGVSLEILKGETVALVGESGCGKSTLGRTLLRLLPVTSGKIYFEGQEITGLKEKEFKPFRSKMQMVFQDPYASLDPRMSVREIIGEPLRTYHLCRTKEEMTEKVLELLGRVGIPGEYLNRYPHQFSGGQRQRIGIARAIALDPALLICDEPVSALDVSVQSQILNLLKHLKGEMGLTSLFIGHDLSVVYFIADRIMVMFLGRICEIASKEELYTRPLHPYTQFLLDAIPHPDPHLRGGQRKLLGGEIPSPVNPPPGCCFHTRCPHATEICRKERPALLDHGGGHLVACHHI